MDLTAHIAQLLYQHDCVVLPDFGAFITQEKPAEFNPLTSGLSPHSKTVSFNSALKVNDGLLASQLSRAEGMDYSEALKAIQSALREMQEQLEAVRHFEMDPIGTFYLGNEGNLLFVAKQASNFSIRSYGLPRIRLNKQTRTVPTAQEADVQEISKQKPVPAIKKRERKPVKAEEVKQMARIQPSGRRSKAFGGLRILNIIGSVFMVALVFAVLNIEFGFSNQLAFVKQHASIADSQFTTPDPGISSEHPSVEKIINKIESNHRRTEFRILLDGTYSRNEVDKISGELKDKYPQNQIIELENGEFTVSVISFSNENLAREYKDLVQRSFNKSLIISVN